MSDQKNASRPWPIGWASSAGRLARRSPTSRNTSTAAPATDCARPRPAGRRSRWPGRRSPARRPRSGRPRGWRAPASAGSARARRPAAVGRVRPGRPARPGYGRPRRRIDSRTPPFRGTTGSGRRGFQRAGRIITGWITGRRRAGPTSHPIEVHPMSNVDVARDPATRRPGDRRPSSWCR